MRNMFLLILNTMKVTFRKKSNILVYIILPLLGVLLSMFMYSGDGLGTLNIGFVNLDSGRLSADLESALSASEGYKVADIDEKDIKEDLLDRKQDAVVMIPDGFEQGIMNNRPLKITVTSLKGQETTAWLENYINLYTKNLTDINTASGGDRAVFDSIYSDYRANPVKVTPVKLADEKNNKLVTLTGIGFMIMFIMLGASFTSQFILNDKKYRAYYRICSAPVSSRSYITANTAASLIIIAIQIILIQLFLKYVFRVETYVPDVLMFLILLLFGLTAVGISLAVTAFSGSSQAAVTVTTLIMTPTCMLGGCFWPVNFMPETMQKISFFVPQRWTLDMISKIQSGQGFDGIVINIAIMLAFSAALFLVAVYGFARSGSLQKFV